MTGDTAGFLKHSKTPAEVPPIMASLTVADLRPMTSPLIDSEVLIGGRPARNREAITGGTAGFPITQKPRPRYCRQWPH
jgi:hypothetical protein